MLYLVTGANGAGKTLNTLKWVRERSVKEGRPVCHNGRFEPVEGGELSTWKKIEFKDWQDQPDGTIFLIDECHNDLPLRPPSATPPDHVKMLAEHRRRGFDFYLVTQHPQNIDAFVRRLIGSPGWHRHLKRAFGGELVSCLEWPAVNPACEKNGSGKTGQATMVAFPKEVFSWYKSASLHTGKKKIPKMLYALAAFAVLVPLALYFAVSKLSSNINKPSKVDDSIVTSSATASSAAAGLPAPVDTVDHYLIQRMPRVPNFLHTAPAYDELTKPTAAPYPAACIQSATACKCYSQQGTTIRVTVDICAQIVRDGFFMDWETSPKREGDKDRVRPVVPNGAPVQVVAPAYRELPMPDFQEPDRSRIGPGQISSALGLRNPAYRTN